MELTIYNTISRNCLRPETGKFIKWPVNFRRSVPNGKRGLHLEAVYNFQTDFPENYRSISLLTEISGRFGCMVYTFKVWAPLLLTLRSKRVFEDRSGTLNICQTLSEQHGQ